MIPVLGIVKTKKSQFVPHQLNDCTHYVVTSFPITLELHSLEVIEDNAWFYLLFGVDVQGLEDSCNLINYCLVQIVPAN